ncbi:MAG TPA: glycosyltransferase [Alphaproteobacteria bacterium]
MSAPPNQTREILHFIAGLETGGAELALYRLVTSGPLAVFRHRVISLSTEGDVGPLIARTGALVETLGMPRAGRLPLKSVMRILSAARRPETAIIQGWMYHGNLAATLAWFGAAGRCPLVWNIRHAIYDLGWEKPRTARIVRSSALLSRLPRAIIYNSAAGAGQHERLGYLHRRRHVIPNGFDLSLFRPDPAARSRLLTELALPEDALLVGLVARYDPHKDHDCFLDAAAQVASRMPQARFIMAGAGVDRENGHLTSRVAALGLDQRVVMLGRRSDVPALLAGLDIACLSSRSEGFPNVVGEAMACGVPCVVTDVGDAGWIVGDTGCVVPPMDAGALAQGIMRVASLSRAERAAWGARARERIKENFSLDAVARQFRSLYDDLLMDRGQAAA